MLKNFLIIGALLCPPFTAHSHSVGPLDASCHEGRNGVIHCHLTEE